MPFPLNSNASSSYSTKFVERPYSRKPCCPNSPSTIIFQGKRSVKRMVIVVVITTVILLFTAIIILILFLAKGGFKTEIFVISQFLFSFHTLLKFQAALTNLKTRLIRKFNFMRLVL
ncbi:hypothetical protein DICVIV_12118 [Dictyocaulus viviparus]|uniref:Uncharacterized protein n=1 Tax=Dictyocaulus viviparus TaxID=29172 RepID=A0A0D8XBE3_DICVI|nr:hypothetical protein DICVIV_12118 [Dictyocaulus viviparus]